MSFYRETLLENKVRAAKFAYYNGQSKMSDTAFDALEAELRVLNPQNPVLSETGAPANLNSPWPQARHAFPMTSLSKAMSMEEFSAWWVAQGVTQAYLSEKQDGISLSLVYDAGQLVQAIVRGDGQMGDDITSNVLKMRHVQTAIPGQFTGLVRGEIRLSKTNLLEARKARPDKAYPNCRNTASGLAREKKGELCGLLDFVAYKVVAPSVKTEVEAFALLVAWGFVTSPGLLVTSPSQVETQYKIYQAGKRNALDYDIDGLVITVDSVAVQDASGLNAEGKPVASVALKFPPRVVKTKILNIRWEMGDSGRLSPIAEVEPVECDGATIRNVSLYNLDFILLHEVTIGSVVEVERRGDIIPNLVRVLERGQSFWR